MWGRRRPEPEPERLFGVEDESEELLLGDVGRAIVTWFSLLAIGLVATVAVGAVVSLGISVVLSFFPLPYEPPWDWVPSGVWHWGVTWLALSGLSGSIGAWAGFRSVRWLSDGRSSRTPRPRLWALGAVCAALFGFGVYQFALIAEEEGVENLRRTPVSPERVCERDRELPPPSWQEGFALYDTNGNGDADVAADGSIRQRSFLVLIDPAEEGQWPSSGDCVEGDFRPRPEG